MTRDAEVCPDLVRAYHEAGHATLDLVFGYGLKHCTIEPGEENEGMVTRINDYVQDGHYIRILAAGEWGEYQSGHDFDRYPFPSGSFQDKLLMIPALLKARGYEVTPEFVTGLPEGLTEQMDADLIEANKYVLECVANDFAETGRMELLHEVAALLLRHRTLPQDVLDDLNSRFPATSPAE